MYRWFNVDVEHEEDGTVTVSFEGRGEFPFGETVELDEGESIRAHGLIEQGDLSEQPDNVDWSFGDMSGGTED